MRLDCGLRRYKHRCSEIRKILRESTLFSGSFSHLFVATTLQITKISVTLNEKIREKTVFEINRLTYSNKRKYIEETYDTIYMYKESSNYNVKRQLIPALFINNPSILAKGYRIKYLVTRICFEFGVSVTS